MTTQDAYSNHIKSLLPRGSAWQADNAPNLKKVIDILAAELVKIDNRATDVLNEADPRATFEMIGDWETMAGLPDTCSNLPDTLQARRDLLVDKITRKGGQSKAFFYSIAAALGYGIEITEYRPFIAGISRCGDAVYGAGHAVRHQWRVKVLSPRVTYFRTGISRAAEKLVTIERADELECLFKRLKPAHTKLIFAYEGV